MFSENQEFIPQYIQRIGFPQNPTCLAFNEILKIVALGCDDGSIYFFHSSNSRKYMVLNSANISDLLFVRNSSKIICVSNRNVLHLLDCGTSSIISRIVLKNEKITFTHVSNEGPLCFCGTNKGNVYIIKIAQDSLTLGPFAIFWNHACKGHAHTHPGGVVLLHLSSSDYILYIAFTGGILSVWSINQQKPMRVFNLFEKIIGASVNDVGFVFGSTDCAYILFDIKSSQVSRHRIVTDDYATGLIWKIRSSNNMILCFGGLSSDTDIGSGLTLIFNDNQVIITKDTVIDAIFYSVTDKVSVLVLTNTSFILYHINIYELQVAENEDYTQFYALSEITSFCTIAINTFNPQSQQIIIASIELDLTIKYKLESAVIIFLGFKDGYKILVCTLDGLTELEISDHISAIYDIEFLPQNEFICFRDKESFNLLAVKDPSITRPLTILCYDRQSGFSSSIVENDNESFSSITNIFGLTHKITYSDEFKFLKIGEFINKNVFIAFNDSINIFNSSFILLYKCNIITDILSKRHSKSKKLKVFNHENKKFRLPDKGSCFIHASYCYVSIESFYYDLILCQHESNNLFSLVFNQDSSVIYYEYLGMIDSEILKIQCESVSLNSDDKSETLQYLIIICPQEILVKQIQEFKTVTKFQSKQNSNFTGVSILYKSYILAMTNSNIISCFSFTQNLHICDIKIGSHSIHCAQLFVRDIYLYLMASYQNNLSWICIAPDISHIHTNCFHSNDSMDENTTGKASFFGFWKRKSIDIVEKLFSPKNIVVDVVAESSSTAMIHGELIMKGQIRGEKLEKSLLEAARLKQSAAGFLHGAKLLAEKSKKGLL